MRNILKNFDRIGLVVLLAAFFVTVGFKATEKVNAPTWYEVEITDLNAPDLPENQEIVGEYPGGEPAGDCDFEDATICAVELLIEEEAPVPATMLEALNRQAAPSPDLEIKQEKHKF